MDDFNPTNYINKYIDNHPDKIMVFKEVFERGKFTDEELEVFWKIIFSFLKPCFFCSVVDIVESIKHEGVGASVVMIDVYINKYLNDHPWIMMVFREIFERGNFSDEEITVFWETIYDFLTPCFVYLFKDFVKYLKNEGLNNESH